MCEKVMPGTVMPYKSGVSVFETFKPMIKAAGGLSLSQVCSITGLEPSTVQNWVKRGFVAHPVNKKYYERQLARILLISALRYAMQIETIGELMTLINGDTEDESDDIISEEELYDYFCKIVLNLGDGTEADETAQDLIHTVTQSYNAPDESARERLSLALTVMALAYSSARMRRLSEFKLAELKKLKS